MTWWGPGVTHIDRVWEMWVHLPPSPHWTQRRGWRLRSSALMAGLCGSGKRSMTANAM